MTPELTGMRLLVVEDAVGSAEPDRPCPQATQWLVDREVARLLRAAEARATDLLKPGRPALDTRARRRLDGSGAYDLVQGAPPVDDRRGRIHAVEQE